MGHRPGGLARRRHAAASVLAALAALGAASAAASAAQGDDADEAARAIAEFVAHRQAYEDPQDPAALASTFSLDEQLERAPAPLAEKERCDRELVHARLEAAWEQGLERAAGCPSKLRSGPPPEPGSEAEARLARRVLALGKLVLDLMPDEIAAARSDTAAERARFPKGPVAGALSDLEKALAQVRSPASRPVRDYLRLLRKTAGYEGTLEDLLAMAEEESEACGERMEALAEETGDASAAALIERLKQDGAREDSVAVGREEAQRSLAFARGLFTIPDEAASTLEVIEGTPRLHTPFGHYLPNGGPHHAGVYVVTTTQGTDVGAISRRRESFRYMIRGVSAHEGIPGHHLHFTVATISHDPVRTLPFEGSTTEGWGLFVEGVLERAGYFKEPREARLTPIRMRRWRADRVILDAGLQTGTLTREQAIGRLQRDVGFDRPVATDEVDRYRERGGYYAGYLLGARAFEAAERRALEKRGPEGARALRDRILSFGPAAPLRAVVRLVR
jgi:hypothetical protein